jgi:hypothetical protein
MKLLIFWKFYNIFYKKFIIKNVVLIYLTVLETK